MGIFELGSLPLALMDVTTGRPAHAFRPCKLQPPI